MSIKNTYKYMKLVKIDLDKEQSIFVKCGNIKLFLFKDYGRGGKRDAVYRQYQKRLAKGLCIAFGCFNKAEKPFKKCQYHLELDRLRKRRKI